MDYILNADLEDVLVGVKKLALKTDKETKIKHKEKDIQLKNVIYLTKLYMSNLPQPLAVLGTKERLMVYNLRIIFMGMYILFDKNSKEFFKSFEKLIINKEKNLSNKEKRTQKDVNSLSDSLIKVTMPAKKKRKNLCTKRAQEEDINVTITPSQLHGIQSESNVNSSLIEEVPKQSIDNERDSFLFSLLNEKSERASSFGNELRLQSATDELSLLINKVSLPSGAEIQVDESVRNVIPEEPPHPQELIALENVQPVEPVPRLLQSDEQFSDFRKSITQSVPYIDEITDLSKPRKYNIPNAKVIKNMFKQVSLYTYEQINKHLNVENRYKQINFHQILSQIPHDENIFLYDEFNVGLKTLNFNFIVDEIEDMEDISEGIVRIREESNISSISGIEFATNLVGPPIISESGLNDLEFIENNLTERNKIENNEQPEQHQITISDKVDNLAQENLLDESLKTKTSEAKETPENLDKIPRKLKKKSKEVQEIITEVSNHVNQSISITRKKKLSDDESDSEDSVITPSSVLEFRQNILNNIELLWRETDTIKFTDICPKEQSRFMAAKVFSSLLGLHSLNKIFLRQESSDPDCIFICQTPQTFPQ